MGSRTEKMIKYTFYVVTTTMFFLLIVAYNNYKVDKIREQAFREGFRSGKAWVYIKILDSRLNHISKMVNKNSKKPISLTKLVKKSRMRYKRLASRYKYLNSWFAINKNKYRRKK